MKRSFSIWAVAGVAVVAVVLGMGISAAVSGDNIFEQLNKLKDVMVIAEKYYLEEVDTKKMTESAIQAMLKDLDPHSVYFPAQSFERVNEDVQGKFQGVGLQITSMNDTVMVVEPIGGGPASRLGIISNDRIVLINDSTAVGLSSNDASKKLRGPKGTKVRVGIKRPNVDEIMTFEITRDDIPLYTVEAAIMMDKNTGYIAVNKFGMNTHKEMQEATQKLRDLGMRQLVLDLRGNPGGVLDEAVKMANLFISGTPQSPKKIVYTKARKPELEEEYFAMGPATFASIPLIVLVNNGSASASEIVSGAVQDWDRGLIVGETSFGKGLVQRQWVLSDRSALRLTIARYYTPSGRLIQRDYKGKDAAEYRREAFERDEEEGENLTHEKDAVKDSTHETFRTFGGRTVYGGGGITPDYVVKPAPLTATTADMMRRDIFFRSIRPYLDNGAMKLKEEYGDNLKRFLDRYQVPESMINDLKDFAVKNGVKVDEKDFEKDLDFIKARMKAYVARHLWSNDGWYAVMLTVDTQYRKAMTLFPEATKLAGLQ